MKHNNKLRRISNLLERERQAKKPHDASNLLQNNPKFK